ncbi:MAG: nucleotide exchange factor GrpE [Ginsengibacter sp.]
MSICLLIIIGKKFDNATFAANFTKMEKNKKHKTEGTMDNHVDAADFSIDENMGQGGEHLESEAVIADDPTEKLKAELAEQKDKYVRLFAEFDNYKRRTSKERIELIQTAGKEVITSLLQVMDDSDRAEKQMQQTNDPAQIKEGVQLVFNKLRRTLQAQGLKAMESLNTDFDVEKHEAITEVPVDDNNLKGKVIDEIEKGYYLNDKLIRFAKVVVGK